MMIDPPLSGPGRKPFPLPAARFTEPKAMLERGDREAFRARYEPLGIDPDVKAEELGACAREAIEQSYAAMNAEPFHVWYRMLRVPSWLVSCGQGPFIGPRDEEELASLNPYVRIKRLPDVGHEAHKLAPRRLIAIVREFLARSEERRVGKECRL